MRHADVKAGVRSHAVTDQKDAIRINVHTLAQVLDGSQDGLVLGSCRGELLSLLITVTGSNDNIAATLCPAARSRTARPPADRFLSGLSFPMQHHEQRIAVSVVVLGREQQIVV